jgi:hypothetical protein
MNRDPINTVSSNNHTASTDGQTLQEKNHRLALPWNRTESKIIVLAFEIGWIEQSLEHGFYPQEAIPKATARLRSLREELTLLSNPYSLLCGSRNSDSTN